MSCTQRAWLITTTGHRLWLTHQTAIRYAEARHLLFGTRQRVKGVQLEDGRWLYRVTTRPAKQ